MSEAKYITSQELRRFVPLGELAYDHLADLASKTIVEVWAKGRTLFKKGATINSSFYLLSGEVAIPNGANPPTIIAGGTKQARFPLVHRNPRPATVTAHTDVRLIRIDNDLLDVLLTWDQNAGYKVGELEAPKADDTDWMTKMLRSNVFQRIPPSNIQAVFVRMKEVSYRAGEVVIRQGAEGDFYYFIKQGRCAVIHTSPKTGKSMKLAELAAGQGFGEEALITNARRNASVTMLTDGVMMRLGKDDFEHLLKAPVLRTVSVEQAKTLVAKGAAWLDVRLDSEFQNSHIRNATNIPLYLLRIKAAGLDPARPYVVYCDTGRRSSSAAYLLNERGFNAFVLEGGLMALKEGQTT